jgi:hypothetical protein
VPIFPNTSKIKAVVPSSHCSFIKLDIVSMLLAVGVMLLAVGVLLAVGG